MQIKKLMSFCALFLLPYSLQAACCEEQCVPRFQDSCRQEPCSPCQDSCSSWSSCLSSCSADWSLEFRLAYYRPSEKNIRKIYSNAFLDYQVELNKRFMDSWQVWMGIDLLSKKKGHSIISGGSGTGDKTRLKMNSVNLGLKYLYCLNECAELYLGAGVNYGMLRIHDESPYVHQHPRRNSFGGLFKVGVYTYLTDHVYLDFFFDYLVQEFKFKNSNSDSYYVERHNVKMSGIKTGVGIGYRF
jgi:outer membrane protein W